MSRTDVVIIGAGQAGLVMSRCLTARGIAHIVLERGRIAERWHSQRWNSLHLLTTAAMSMLPGLVHVGDPGAFMPASTFAAYLASYAEAVAAPIISGVDVISVEAAAGGYRVHTSAGDWRTRAIVVATGACDTPYRPAAAQRLDASIMQIDAADYRAPAQLPDGGVLVVGASSTGVQLAQEIHASGRPVTLAVGDHTRAPRRYRGDDIFARMELAGILDEPPHMGANLEQVRRQPSLQLIGRPDHSELNLEVLSRGGVQLAGRLADMDGTRVILGDNLARSAGASHARMVRMLDRIDQAIAAQGLDAPASDPDARAPFLPGRDALTLDLHRAGIRTVMWAAGYARRYPWLKLPVLDDRGEIVQRGGVTGAPGVFTMGLVFMRRRRSPFIDGCALDAEDLAPMIAAHLDLAARQVA
jgi:putative flavoprotein involved in K+ transport